MAWYFALVQIDEENQKFYWNDFLYTLFPDHKGLKRGEIVGINTSGDEFIMINRYTFNARMQNTNKRYNYKKEKNYFKWLKQ